MSDLITKILAREVLDSRGNPTVECEVYTEKGMGRFIVPSGASTGEYEAVELRDGDSRFHGKGVMRAVKNIREVIAPKVVGRDVHDQEGLDKLMLELDGTDNKGNLGANAILGVSIAAVKASALAQGIPLYRRLGEGNRLPCPMLNVINGGKHAGGDLAIQEFMILPIGFENIREGLRASSEVYHSLKKYLKKTYGSSAINVGDEGGFAPAIDQTRDALLALDKAVSDAGYSMSEHFAVGIDAAASEFFEGGKYLVDGKQLTPDEMVEYYVEVSEEFPFLISIEDPFEENDYSSFAKLKSRYSGAIVGDDLTVTNVKRIQDAITHDAMNYLLLKVNQIGTLTEAKSAFDLTKEQGWGVVVSHRSGETEDSFIADLTVGWSAERIKTGAPARSERVAKYNQLMRIEEYLGEEATYYHSK